MGSGSFLSTVVRSEVASRSAGIDWRRGFDPIDRSIFVDSRAVFSSLIHTSANWQSPVFEMLLIPDLWLRLVLRP